MTVRELMGNLANSENGAVGLTWVLVGSEERKQQHVEALIAGGHEHECDLSDEECLSRTTIVAPNVDEDKFWSGEEDERLEGILPVFALVLTGDMATVLAEALKMPVVATGIMSGLDPKRFSQKALEDALAGQIDNIEDFLGDVLGGDQ
jgi:hypothetical protein